jgi:hypothetical protein
MAGTDAPAPALPACEKPPWARSNLQGPALFRARALATAGPSPALRIAGGNGARNR